MAVQVRVPEHRGRSIPLTHREGTSELRQHSLRGAGRVSLELTWGFRAAGTLVPECGSSLRMSEVWD